MPLDTDEDHALLCPACRCPFVHLDFLVATAGTDQYVVEATGEDERAHLHVQQVGRYHPLRRCTTGRRHSFTAAGHCEQCGNPVRLELRQHKGQTLVTFTVEP